MNRWGAPLVFLASLAYLLLFRAYGFQVEDEGTMLFQLNRVLGGQLPYVDFHTGYTPGFFYGGAGLLGLCGGSVVAFRTALSILNAATAMGLYAVARRVAGPWMAILPPLIWLVFVPIYAGEFVAFNVPYPTWPATAAWVVAALVLLSWADRGGLSRIVAAGLAAAAALSFRPDAGAFVLAAATWIVAAFSRREDILDRIAAISACVFMGLGVWFAFDFRAWGSDAFVHLLPTLAVVVLWAGPLAGTNATSTAYPRATPALAVLATSFLAPTLIWMAPLYGTLGHELFLREVLLVGADYATLYYTGHPPPELHAAVVVLAAIAFAALGRLVRRRRLDPVAPLTAASVLLIAVAVAALTLGLAPEGRVASIWAQLENSGFWLTPLANFAALFLLARHRLRGTEEIDRPLLVLTPLAIAMYLELFPRSDFMHQITAAPLSIVIAVGLLVRVVGWWSRGRWPHRVDGARVLHRGIAAATVVVCLLRLSHVLPGLLSTVSAGKPAADAGPIRSIAVEPEAGDDLRALMMTAAYIRERTSQAESVWAFPATSAVLLAAGRSAPLPHDYWFAGRPDKTAEVDMLEKIRQKPPHYVVTFNSGWNFFRDAPSYFDSTRAFVVGSYRLVARFGRYDVLAHESVVEATTPVSFPPPGTMQDAIEPSLAARRQAARRWMAGMEPSDAARARLPQAPRSAVLLLRAIRDGGDFRAAGWVIAGLNSSQPRVRHDAQRAADRLVKNLDAARHRWADDFDAAEQARFLLPHAEAARSLLGSPNASAFARSVLGLIAEGADSVGAPRPPTPR